MDDKYKELSKRVEHDLRYIPAENFNPRSVLSTDQWEVDRLLRLHLKSDWFVFVGTGLSAFFNPKLYFDVSDDEAELILKSSTLFSIASSPPKCELRLVVIEPGNFFLEKFLAKHGVQWLHFSELISPEEFAREVDITLAQTPAKEHTQRQPINLAELRVRRALMDLAGYEAENSPTLAFFMKHGVQHDDAHLDLARSSYRLLHEVALRRLEPAFPFHLSEFQRWILATSSVDVLLHSRDESSRPLVAVEVDGPHHLESKQFAKDCAKNEVLKAFGISLFRITPQDAAFWDYPAKLSIAHKDHLKSFSMLIRDVVLTAATWINIFGKLQADVDACEEACVKEEDALAKAVFDKSYMDLTKEQKSLVADRLIYSEADNNRNTALQLYHHELERAIESAKEQSSWPTDVAPYLSVALMHGDIETGLSASTILSMNGFEPLEFFSPSIRGSVERIEPELITASIDECFVHFLADEARRQIRMRTPAKRS